MKHPKTELITWQQKNEDSMEKTIFVTIFHGRRELLILGKN